MSYAQSGRSTHSAMLSPGRPFVASLQATSPAPSFAGRYALALGHSALLAHTVLIVPTNKWGLDLLIRSKPRFA